ncbi:MAG: hypothetical protein O7A03_06450 [Alphaproteobacteria bacterium]|nr:hypothetical protein [Alphaproteobacteria bacterium]
MTRSRKAAPTQAQLAHLRQVHRTHFEMENPIAELREATELLTLAIAEEDEPPVWLARAIARMAHDLDCLYHRNDKVAP